MTFWFLNDYAVKKPYMSAKYFAVQSTLCVLNETMNEQDLTKNNEDLEVS
ncbi:MAG: hypothetical protein ACXAC0_10820 [Candidatus Thorarchaeota archaeon]